MFVITCMPIGGAETLLVSLIRGLDRERFSPELCCLKFLGPLGEELAPEIPVHTGLLAHKYDFAVLGRLTRLLRERRIDAVVTVGTGGDKMFWGRLAAWRAGVPVVCSALHSTGLPDHVEFPNRLLAPLTDAFIAVAPSHADYLARHEGCPAKRVRVIPNGVDTSRFRPLQPDPELRASLGLPHGAPVVAIVAALRPEKNHELFLRAAARVVVDRPDAHFLVIGDGEQRQRLEEHRRLLDLEQRVHFLGARADVPQLLALVDVLALSSKMEANPVSILEALACGKPVVAPRVGSIPDVVQDVVHGLLVAPADEQALATALLRLINAPELAHRQGDAGRELVVHCWSVAGMIRGYQDLLAETYARKAARQVATRPPSEAVAVRSETP
jgi:glycosyltransferase involved in cell wall biosynthesis